MKLFLNYWRTKFSNAHLDNVQRFQWRNILNKTITRKQKSNSNTSHRKTVPFSLSKNFFFLALKSQYGVGGGELDANIIKIAIGQT